MYIMLTVVPTLIKFSRFRLVPASDFLANFASDRSHMVRFITVLPSLSSADPSQFPQLIPPSPALDAAPLFTTSSPAPVNSASIPPSYAHSPPPYPPIQGEMAAEHGEKHNLWTKWLDVAFPGEGGGDGSGGSEAGFGEVLSSPAELLQQRWLQS
jgi:hypothetical protein